MLERLKKIENLEHRQLLKDVMNGIFSSLIDYQQEMNERLEQRLLDELKSTEQQLGIYGTIVAREQFDPIHECLFPINPADTEHQQLTLDDLVPNAVLSTVFLQCDTRHIEHLLAANRYFNGVLQTTAGDYPIKLTLAQHTTYTKAVAQLYKTFQINGFAWKTINHPYLYKFIDICLVAQPAVQEQAEIVGVTVDLEEYEPYKKTDMLPLWNIERLAVKDTGFPVPAIDKVNFEHELSLRRLGLEHGYLIEGEEELNIRYVKRHTDHLTIVSAEDISGMWPVMKVTKVEQDKLGLLPYELFTNQPIDHFMQRLRTSYPVAIHTAGELIQLIQSFQLSNRLIFDRFEIIEHDAVVIETLNPFIAEIIDNPQHKKTLLLYFQAVEAQDFVVHDLLRYIVSEVQRYFFEYNCVGVWQ